MGTHPGTTAASRTARQHLTAFWDTQAAAFHQWCFSSKEGDDVLISSGTFLLYELERKHFSKKKENLCEQSAPPRSCCSRAAQDWAVRFPLNVKLPGW